MGLAKTFRQEIGRCIKMAEKNKGYILLFTSSPDKKIQITERYYSMRYKVLILCTLLIISTGAYCQQDSSTRSNQISVKNSGSDEISIPRPNALNTNWWDYFNVDDNQLLPRIKLAKQQYATLLVALEKTQQDAARQTIDRLISNLLSH